MHVVPLPSEDELAEEYRHEYYAREKPLYIERYREDLEWWTMVYVERLETFERLVGPGRRKLLEIGSGPGFFLQAGKERGWDVLGVEPAVKAWEHAQSLGLEVLNDVFDDEVRCRLPLFDGVHLSAVLEHVPNPAQMLRAIGDTLNPGGVLCVVVPNDFSEFQRASRETEGLRPWWIAPPHHLNYFNFDSLEALVERMGFTVEVRDTTFPIDMFLLMGEDYVDNDEVGRSCHRRRMRFETNLQRAGLVELKQRFYRACAGLGIGREIVLFARKR